MSEIPSTTMTAASTESTTETVVDIPASSVDEFKRQSGVAEFAPGRSVIVELLLGRDRRGHLLSTDTETSTRSKGYRDLRRKVVIHNHGGETRKVFVHGGC